ncbi:MAG: HAD family phosphatase [Spirosomaceae bacterium]|nr:HAD family phosphatase [Spirosomataceae bacterium]MDP5139535.1 HAD family phosphatase [Spirosomataceae bacterium]
MKDKFEAIIFDFGNVIIDIDFELMYKGFAEGSGKSIEVIKNRMTESQVFRRYESGFFTDPEFREVIRQTIGFPFNDGEIDRIWNSMLLHIPPNRIELIRYLNTKYPVYLLSNTNALHINWCNEYLKEHFQVNHVNDLFTKAFLSYEIELWKPDEAIYQHVLGEIGISADKVIFFDDNLSNIEAAKALGIQSVQITPKFGILNYFKDQTN